MRRFRKRIETAAHSLPCGSCGAVPDPTQHVLLPFKLGGNTHDMTTTERKTATLLEPLTMDRQEDGSFDPGTYCEYWLYKDAVSPATDTICLCTSCRVSLSRRDLHKFRKRNGFDMFDNYPEELAILNPLETALVSILIPTNRMFRRHHYQQTHSIGQTLTFWNSTQTVATCLPRGTNDSSILILTDEHGNNVLDDTPLHVHAISAVLKYLKENNEHYSSVTIDSVAIDNLQGSTCPFVTERDPEPQLEEYASYGTLCADSGGPQDSAQHYPGSPRYSMPQPEGVHRYGEHADLHQIVRREDTPRRNQSAPGWVEDTDTPNVFVVRDNERATLKALALAAFGGKNRPVMPEPGHTAETVMDRCS